ncbi:TonB family protein [uncultured Roseivirga sp.]|uniref:energy transducer TonB n=1 Tax=uncultured Roseivirga sp. TaxID=543088 RepID=UPI0030DA62C8|tara:strand:- start:91012 stop:91677 length:666 start_codon:yes stop_codon:yes gene_type:complete
METKKNDRVCIESKRSLFLFIGLCISLGLSLVAFEHKTVPTTPPVLPYDNGDYESFDEPPVTIFEPPKPVIQQPVLVEIPNDETPAIVIDYTFEADPTNIKLPALTEVITEKPEKARDEFIIVEKEASFPGGNEAWAKFLNKNFKYPKNAQRMGIEGRVILTFYVAANGEISDLKVLRGISKDCDTEAIRVLSKSPRWNPGLQRGVPVKSPRMVTINFKLN